MRLSKLRWALVALTLALASGLVLAQSNTSTGGTFNPILNYVLEGTWIWKGASPLQFEGATNDSKTTTLAITDPTANRTWTLPDATDTVVGKATTDILTNKTLTSPTLTSPTISGTPVISGAALSSGNFLGQPAVQSSASLGGSPVTLTAAQCGQAFALDAATGVVYLLPATFPTAGCTYDFYVTVSVTSNAHEIETNNAAHFFGGAPFMIAAGATLATGQCNGTSHIAYKTNGTTTGGLIGTHIKATVLSATVAWLDGVNAGSGSLATACSASN